MTDILRGGAGSAEESISTTNYTKFHEKDKYSFTMKGLKSMKIIHESANVRGAAAYIHGLRFYLGVLRALCGNCPVFLRELRASA